MAQITLRGNRITTSGDLPAIGSPAPAFTLTGTNLADVTAADFAGKTLVLNIFPSIDTGTCAQSVRTFNEKAAGTTPSCSTSRPISLSPKPDSAGLRESTTCRRRRRSAATSATPTA